MLVLRLPDRSGLSARLPRIGIRIVVVGASICVAFYAATTPILDKTTFAITHFRHAKTPNLSNQKCSTGAGVTLGCGPLRGGAASVLNGVSLMREASHAAVRLVALSLFASLPAPVWVVPSRARTGCLRRIARVQNGNG